MRILTFLAILTLCLSSCFSLEREFQSDRGIKLETPPDTDDSDYASPGNPNTQITDCGEDDSIDNSSEDLDYERTKCSELVCRLKCHLFEKCYRSACLPDGRCSCTCHKRTNPIDNLFRTLLSHHFDSQFTSEHFRNLSPERFPPKDDFVKTFFGQNDRGKVYYTLQQMCMTDNECMATCANCTNVSCKNQQCSCTDCKHREHPRGWKPVEQECRIAPDCESQCHDCSKTVCRYGLCECSLCATPARRPTKPTTTTNLPITTEESSTESVNTSTQTPDIPTSTATQETLITCMPDRCNQACWKRNCSTWKCNNDGACECDGCPDEVAVLLKGDTKENKTAGEDSKYEIIP